MSPPRGAAAAAAALARPSAVSSAVAPLPRKRGPAPPSPDLLAKLRRAARRASSSAAKGTSSRSAFAAAVVPTAVRQWIAWFRKPLSLYRLHEIPAHLQDNEFILGSHRAFYSYAECTRSMFHVHNETVNIWTHLLGAIAFIAFVAHALNDVVHPLATSGDRAAMALYLACAFVCLLCSGVFHTYHCHAERRVFDTMAITDYTGIATMLFGSFIALEFFAFRPHPALLPIPLSITALASLSGAVLPWFPFFRSYRYRTLRTVIIFTLCTAITASVAWAAFAIWHEVRAAWTWAWAGWALGVFASYGGGAVIYATRFPECLAPGKFDIVGSSHQWWHQLVISGAVCHWNLLIVLRDWRLEQDAVAAAAMAMS
ncbi:minc metabolism membrane protein [Blastocladiella emersonii ATCC 22665]|nr:minc metabolism membrane protein [Blastocladiella emersonii ATCC 22665]